MSTNESCKRSDDPMEIESTAFNAIQLDHFKPVLHPQVNNYRELDQSTSYKYKPLRYQKLYEVQVLIITLFYLSGEGCCGGFASSLLQGLLPQGSFPATIAIQSSLPIKHQRCSTRYPLAPNNSLTAPTCSSGFPCTPYQTKPHGSVIAPS